MINAEARRLALAEFPELQRLIDLVGAGWVFLPTVVDGVVTEVHGVHAWSGGWADAIRVRYTTDAKAIRVDHDGGMVWQHEGTLHGVVDGLVALPAPDTPGAPRLVKGSVRLRLWTP